jgi:hypothetical protein
MGRAIHGHGKVEDEGVSSLGLPRQNDGAFLECGQSLSFLCLNQLVKSEGLMNYKRAFVVEHRVTCLLFEARALFLTGETSKSVRFLMRQSTCTPKQ